MIFIKLSRIIAVLVLLLFILPTNSTAQTENDTITDSLAVFNNTADTVKAVIYNNDGTQLYPMSVERKEKLVSYSQFTNIWRFVEFFVGLLILSIILFTGLSAKLRNLANSGKKKFFIIWLYLILFIIVDYILSFPFHYYRSFMVESNYGFMNQNFQEWFSEDLLNLLITMAFAIIPVWFLYRVIDKVKRWWLMFTLGAIPFIILTIIIVPVFISPLFNDYTELKDKQLETEILNLASEAGIEGSDVFQVNASKQSSKINAYVTGMFGTKRIVLYDTMIDNFTANEIRFVMGHEMGHYVLNHIWQMIPLIIIIFGFTLWLTSVTIQKVIDRFKSRFKFEKLSDIASLPLIILYMNLIMFILNPVMNGFSRYNEHQSDIYGMDITGVDGETAATAFDKLSAFNLSDPDPHPVIEFWFYSHPALTKRMEFVRNYK